jgi:hypothetical protein
MLKFIWGKGQGPSAERVRVQKQLFGFSREVTHGFPSKPVCFAWDSELKLLCIAAKVRNICFICQVLFYFLKFFLKIMKY